MPQTAESPEVVDTEEVAIRPEDMAPATPHEPVDRKTLERNVSAGLEKAFADSDEPAPEPEAEIEPTPEKEPADEKPEPDEAVADPEPAPTLPVIPDAYRRSLKAYEWSDDEITEALKTYGPKFIETAAKIHKNRNTEISQWADAGRKAREAAAQSQQQQQVAPQPQQPAPKVADLRKQYGENEPLVTALETALQRLERMEAVTQQSQQRSWQAEQEMLGRQIDGFFNSKQLKTYEPFYKDPMNKNRVLETADALLFGAKASGRNLSFDEAMTLAHDSVSSGFKETAVREQIVGQLKTREKGITLRPSTRTPPAPAKTRADLERRVNAGLKAVFPNS